MKNHCFKNVPQILFLHKALLQLRSHEGSFKRHAVNFSINILQTGRLKKGLKLTDHKPGLDKTSPRKKLSKSPCQLPLAKIKGKEKKIDLPLHT